MKLKLQVEDDQQIFSLTTPAGEPIDGIDTIELHTNSCGRHQAVVRINIDAGELSLSGKPAPFQIDAR